MRAPFLTSLLIIPSLASSFASAFAQADPPAGIPRTVHVCDQVGILKACADWVWNGQDFNYDYGRASGTGTITRDGDSGLSLRRVDTHARWPIKAGEVRYTGTIDHDGSGRGRSTYLVEGHPPFEGSWSASIFPPAPKTTAFTTQQDRKLRPTDTARYQIRQKEGESGSGVELSNSAEICRSPAMRVAMQKVEDQLFKGIAYSLSKAYVCGETDVCVAENTSPEIKQSRPASDDEGLTANDPGSFLCQGLFRRGAATVTGGDNEQFGSEWARDLTKGVLTSQSFILDQFKVRPLSDGEFLLLSIPPLPILPVYSSKFIFP